VAGSPTAGDARGIGGQGAQGGLRIVDDRAALARAAAELVAAAAEEALAARGAFRLVLSGGSTPRDLYLLLADEREPYRARLDWPHVHLFWGDERPVPPDHPESNFGMAREALIARVPVSEENVHRMRGEAPPERAAEEYEALLRGLARGAPSGDRARSELAVSDSALFDLALMGLGPEGHTASLFPGSPAIEERERLVVAPWVPSHSTFRITLTPPAFAAAERVLFLVAGADKAAALVRSLAGDEPPASCPARAIRPRTGAPLWLADRAAAARLPPTTPGAQT
jgi:6-phosphogluconolactonase